MESHAAKLEDAIGITLRVVIFSEGLTKNINGSRARRCSLLNKDGANSSAHWTLGSNEFPTENLLSDPHSPLPLYRSAFELHSEPLWLTRLMGLRHCVCAFSPCLCFVWA